MTNICNDKAVIRGYLEHLRTSAAFARSRALYMLLEYVVNEALDGRGNTLKELVIGDALYGRAVPYDPRIDSAVRVEARRLRRKLAEHYAGPGRHDPVRIGLPTGRYLPEFESICDMAPAACAPEPVAGLAGDARGLSVDLAIMPFRALSGREKDGCFVDGLTDQLIFALGMRSRLRLAPRLAVFQYKNRHYTVPEVVESLGVEAMLHGTYRSAGEKTRVTVELCDGQGFVTWSAQFDHGVAEDIILQERLSSEIVSRMPSWILESTTWARPLMAVAS